MTSVQEARTAPELHGTAARILDAAAHLLARRGYGGLRIHDVARTADVRPAAIYYYFASREELVEEVLWFGMARLRSHVEGILAALPAETSARDRLLRLVEEHLRYELAVSDYTQASIRNAGQVPPGIRERQRQEFRAYRDLWIGIVDRAAGAAGLAPDPDRRLEVMLVIGALNWAAEWWRPERGDLEAVVAQARIFVGNGLLPAADGVSRAPAAPSPAAVLDRPGGTRERILSATAATLRARGYAKTHLAEVAERCSVQAPAIYHYFPSRDALISAVLIEGQRTVGDHMEQALTALPEGADARTRMATLCVSYLWVELELSDFATAMTRNVGQVPPALREALAVGGERLHAIWQAPLVDAFTSGVLREGLDPRLARLLVIGALTWVPEWWQPGIPVDRVVAAAHRVIDAGLFRPGI